MYSQPPPLPPTAAAALHQPQPDDDVAHAVQFSIAPHIAEPLHDVVDTGVEPIAHLGEAPMPTYSQPPVAPSAENVLHQPQPAIAAHVPQSPSALHALFMSALHVVRGLRMPLLHFAPLVYSQPPPSEPNTAAALHQPQPIADSAPVHVVQLANAPQVAAPAHVAVATGEVPNGHLPLSPR